MFTTSEWLKSDKQTSQKIVNEEIAQKFRFQCMVEEKCGNCNAKHTIEPLCMSEDFVKFECDQNSLCHQVDGHNCGLASVMSCMKLVDASVGATLESSWKFNEKAKMD